MLGSAGVDLLRGGPSLLDVRGKAWTRRPDAADLTAVDGAVSPPHVWDRGVIVVTAGLDGKPVRLVLDTGAGHSVWIGQQPRPGDVEVVTQDYLGRDLHLFQGTASLELGGVTRSLPVLRAPSFPGVEEDFAQRDIQGLLGLSAFDALFVDEPSGTLAIALRRE